jgi:hypothetical protein
VSDLLALPPDDGGADDDDDTSRGRAVWGLVALAILAVLIVVIMIATSGSGGHHGSGGPTGLSSLPSEPGPLPSSTGAPTTSTTTSSSASSTATSALPTSTANPCGAAKSCIVPGDAGQLVAAINRFRTSHGRTAVTGAASPQAQQCSIAQGDGPACAPSYAWEPVGTQDGPKAVERVAARGDGTKWLLDPGMKSFSVGWSYAGGQYACAILKIS